MAKPTLPPLRVYADSREPCPENDPEPALFLPWHVRGGKSLYPPLERVTLREGDYSLPGFAMWKPIGEDAGEWRGEPWAILERKSIGDAISTVVGGGTSALGEATANRDRFAEEMRRMRDYHFRTIVVEGVQECHLDGAGWAAGRYNPKCIQCEAARPERRFSALGVLSSYAVFAVRFGVQVWWGGSKAGAEWYVGTTLARIWEEYVGGEACKKALERGDTMPWIGKGVGLTESANHAA